MYNQPLETYHIRTNRTIYEILGHYLEGLRHLTETTFSEKDFRQKKCVYKRIRLPFMHMQHNDLIIS